MFLRQRLLLLTRLVPSGAGLHLWINSFPSFLALILEAAVAFSSVAHGSGDDLNEWAHEKVYLQPVCLSSFCWSTTVGTGTSFFQSLIWLSIRFDCNGCSANNEWATALGSWLCLQMYGWDYIYVHTLLFNCPCKCEHFSLKYSWMEAILLLLPYKF